MSANDSQLLTCRTAAIVLAAGASTRLGQLKQLVTLNGETLLARAVRMAHEAGCAPILVVLGAEAERIRATCPLPEAHIVINDSWREGMASSVRAGIATLQALAQKNVLHGAILMTCDQPAVTAEHLCALAASGEIAASEYAGRRGVPAYFPAGWFGKLAGLSGDAGARELLRGARAVPLVGGELDIDTPEALAEARQRGL